MPDAQFEAPIVLNAGDKFGFISRNRVSGITVRLTAIILDMNGNPSGQTVVAEASLSDTAFANVVTEGTAYVAKRGDVVLSMGFTASGFSAAVGHTYVVGGIIRGGVIIGPSCSGWIYTGSAPVWPKGTADSWGPPDGGAQFSYHVDFVNGGVNAGVHSVTVAPGGGNRLEDLHCRSFNGDAAGVVHEAWVTTDDVTEPLYQSGIGITANAGSPHSSPNAGSQTAAGSVGSGLGVIVAGTQNFFFQTGSVAVSQETEFGLYATLFGAVPTITEAAPAGATVTINRELVEVG